MIKAVAFDLGGVLFAEGKAVAMERLEKDEGYDKDIVYKILTSPESFELRKGLIKDEDFWDLMQTRLPKKYDVYKIKVVWYDSYILDKDILELIKALKKGNNIIAFSGNIESRVNFLDEKYKFRQYFDEEVYSFSYHVNKPEKKFVEIMIKRAECKPEEIVYIDDQEKDSFVAKELNVNVILYSRGKIQDLKRRLKSLGVGF